MSVARARVENDWLFHLLLVWTFIVVFWAFLTLVYEVVTSGY